MFQAFKEVEVALRTKGNFAPTRHWGCVNEKGVDVDNGPLTDMNDPKAERQALSNLFADAIGSYKNPSSHRHVTIDAPEAVKMIVLVTIFLGLLTPEDQPVSPEDRIMPE